MKHPSTMNRRTFLTGGIVLGGSILMGRLLPRFWLRPPADRLVAFLQHQGSARRVGRAYLRTAPEEAGRRRLVTLIAADLPKGHRALQADDRDLQASILGAITADYEAENTVLVGGWVLSATEARLCALVAVG